MRLNYGRTFLIGSAFLGLQVLFAIYNAYMPLFLQSGRPGFAEQTALEGGFGLGAALTGFIMSLENLAALLILPVIGFSSNLPLIRFLLVIAGAGWSMIAVNALPMVLDCAPRDGIQRIGAYTGIYFIATQTAEVLGPTLLGILLDLTGRDFRLIFAYGMTVLIIGSLLLTRVKRGEAVV